MSRRESVDLARFRAPDKVTTRPDLRDIYRSITPQHATIWKNIGMELKLPVATLSIIETDYPHSVERCCNEMLSRWLEIDTSASWQKLLTAIDTCTTQADNQDGMLDEVQNMLKTAYKHTYQSDSPHCYVQLTMVQDEICDLDDKELNEITSYAMQGQVNEIVKIREPLKRGLEDVFHYNNKSCPRLIFILGAPGIGKTTLANEICLKWAMDKDSFLSNDYDLVILIQLKTVGEKTLHQVMIENVGSEAAYNKLLAKSYGKRCLIILEGLDEISPHWQQNDKMFQQLLNQNTFLSYANILVTTRPHACMHLHENTKRVSRRIEIVGFDKSQIKKYAEKYFHESKNTAEKFIKQVNSDPHISNLCYVPLCLNMVLRSFRYDKGGETPRNTLTKLYQKFIVSEVNKHIKFKKNLPLGTILESDKECFKKLDSVMNDIPEVLKGTLETMFLLSKLAYKSYFEWYELKHRPDLKADILNTAVIEETPTGVVHHLKFPESYDHFEFLSVNKKSPKFPKIVYVKKDLAQCNIINLENDACGLLKVTNTLYGTDTTAVYTFNHLSVQEYFCALYISLLPEDQQLQLLKDHITGYPDMWPFYAGITKLRSSTVLHYLRQLLLQDNQLEKPSSIDCRNIVKNYNISNFQTVVAINSICEAQLLPSDVCNQEIFSVFIDFHRLLPYDCMCISYFMSITPITQLYLQHCNIGDQEAEILGKSQDVIPSLKVLDFNSNHVTHRGLKSLIPIITNLTHLSAAYNPLTDDGIRVLLSLQFSHLIQLDLRCTQMTGSGNIALAKGLAECFQCNNSLQSLEINDNNICTGLSVMLIIKSLIRLTLKNCNLNFSYTSIELSMILKFCFLKYLEISGNSIENYGISALCFGLHTNTTLVQLLAHSCGFDVKGAESIAEVLQVNKTLKYLNISNNDIQDDGVTAVTQSIEVNTTLVQLKICDCRHGCKGLDSVDKMLMVNKTLRELYISVRSGNIDTATSTVLEIFLKQDCKLTQLNIVGMPNGLQQYVDKANLDKSYTNTAYCTMDADIIRPYGDGAYLRHVLKKHDHVHCTDHMANRASDDTEGWLIDDDIQSNTGLSTNRYWERMKYVSSNHKVRYSATLIA